MGRRGVVTPGPRYRQSRFTTRIRIEPLTANTASIAQNNSILP
jgi:hypothetical protein